MKFTNCAETGAGMVVGTYRMESDVSVRRRERGLRARVIGIVRRVVRRTATENAVRGVSVNTDRTVTRRLKDAADAMHTNPATVLLERDRPAETENGMIASHAIPPVPDLLTTTANPRKRATSRSAKCR